MRGGLELGVLAQCLRPVFVKFSLLCFFYEGLAKVYSICVCMCVYTQFIYQPVHAGTHNGKQLMFTAKFMKNQKSHRCRCIMYYDLSSFSSFLYYSTSKHVFKTALYM
jgi:hypothetical protein